MNNKLYDKYNWDLEDILKGKSLETLYNQWKASEEKIIKAYPTFANSLANFKAWCKLGEINEELDNRLSNYISNKLSENTIDEQFLAWEQKVDIQAQKYNEQTSGLINKVIENEAKIRKYLKDKSLTKYTRGYEKLFEKKKHILSSIENKLLSKIGINGGAVPSIFTTLVDSDIKFDSALDSKRKLHELTTASDVHKNLKSKDRILRKNSWINFHKAYSKFESTLTQTLYYNYLKFNTFAKLHNYDDYIDRACKSDEVDKAFINNLYTHVEKFKPIYQTYKKLTREKIKAKLKLNKLEPWDMGVDLTTNELTFSIKDMQNTIKTGLSVLGKEYVNYVNKIMNEKWISYLPKQNKHIGAYSIGGTKGLDKFYILMNFDGTYDSVSTLAHEIGHSINSIYYNKAQPVYASTSIFTAEIPSILNETLLGVYMINKYKSNKQIKQNYIREICDNFFNTTTRQIIFSNFEYEANALINEGKPFTKETVKELYKKMILKYSVNKINKKTKPPYTYSDSTILRISHFYAGNFYVYKYAVGQIVAICLANKILNKEKGIMDKFIKFLESGTSRSPLDTIKLLGIDLNKPEPYIEAIEFINKLLKEYK